MAFVTGAARGQGRSHARRLAEEGADIIAIDACATPGWLSYPLAGEEDLAQTVKEVEALDRRIAARRADVRDLGAVRAVLDEGVALLGVAQASIAMMSAPSSARRRACDLPWPRAAPVTNATFPSSSPMSGHPSLGIASCCYHVHLDRLLLSRSPGWHAHPPGLILLLSSHAGSK